MRSSRLAVKYIFFEMVPSFVLGILVFLSILLLFQTLRLTEFLLAHGGSGWAVLSILYHLSMSFLPIILPMSLLFSVLMTYGRLNQESELVAMRSLGLSSWSLALPGFIMGTLGFVFSAYTSFELGPKGNRKFEVMINNLGQQKVGLNLREGVFSSGYFDLVIYANKIDSKNDSMWDVFIYDERNPSAPLTIIAQKGKILQQKTPLGNAALLRLEKGNIHKTSNATYTKLDFDTYDINLFDPYEMSEKKKSLPSYTLGDIQEELAKPDVDPQLKTKLQIEFHRRWALSVACFVFALVGYILGSRGHRRSAKSGGFVLCLGIILSYWILYVTAESIAKSGKVPVGVAIWSVNVLFFVFAFVLRRRSQ